MFELFTHFLQRVLVVSRVFKCELPQFRAIRSGFCTKCKRDNMTSKTFSRRFCIWHRSPGSYIRKALTGCDMRKLDAPVTRLLSTLCSPRKPILDCFLATVTTAIFFLQLQSAPRFSGAKQTVSVPRNQRLLLKMFCAQNGQCWLCIQWAREYLESGETVLAS